MPDVVCPGCGGRVLVTSNTEIDVELERRDDGSYEIYAVGRSDAPLSSVEGSVHDFGRGTSETHYSGPLHSLSIDGTSETIDPSVRDERITLAHECYDDEAVRLLESLIECPHCAESFSYEYRGEGPVTEEPLRVEWEKLYDGRLRAWKVGTQILPDDAPVPRHPIRECVHECDPHGRRDDDQPGDGPWGGYPPEWPDVGGGSHVRASPPKTPPSGTTSIE